MLQTQERCLNSALGFCYASYVDCLLARLGWTLDLPETYRALYQNKLEK